MKLKMAPEEEEVPFDSCRAAASLERNKGCSGVEVSLLVALVLPYNISTTDFWGPSNDSAGKDGVIGTLMGVPPDDDVAGDENDDDVMPSTI